MLLNPLKFGPIYFHCKCHSIILFVNIITPSILFKNVLNVKKSPKLYKAEKQASKQTKEKVKKALFKYSSHMYQRLHGCQRVRIPNKKCLAQQTRYG